MERIEVTFTEQDGEELKRTRSSVRELTKALVADIIEGVKTSDQLRGDKRYLDEVIEKSIRLTSLQEQSNQLQGSIR